MSAMPCVQYVPVVCRSSTSAPVAAALVYTLSRFGAVGSCSKSATSWMLVPWMACLKPFR